MTEEGKKRVLDLQELRMQQAEDKDKAEPGPIRDNLCTGYLQLHPEGYGFLKTDGATLLGRDVYVSASMVRRFALRPGDKITGHFVFKTGERTPQINFIKTINEVGIDKAFRRPRFDKLTASYPTERLRLEMPHGDISTRLMDLVSPVGKGSRGVIVAPPKAGKTSLLEAIAHSVEKNHPECKLYVLLVDERPEEVTEMKRSVTGEVFYSTFDSKPENHVQVAEMLLDRAMRRVEMGEDVVILLDSLTRLARAYNHVGESSGRTLSGGLDATALFGPKRFFGAARNTAEAGSLTILATALVDTGSRMDELIFEEFKGTGNLELFLDRKMAERRLFPAVDFLRSGTRREELLLSERELLVMNRLRSDFAKLDNTELMEFLLRHLRQSSTNEEFLLRIEKALQHKEQLGSKFSFS